MVQEPVIHGCLSELKAHIVSALFLLMNCSRPVSYRVMESMIQVVVITHF